MNKQPMQWYFEVYVKGCWYRQPGTFGDFTAAQQVAIANKRHPYRIKKEPNLSVQTLEVAP